MNNEEKKEENQVFDLATIKVSSLPQVNGMREAQEKLVADNPLIIPVDTETLKEAKKRRTTYVTARTGLTGGDKVLASVLKKIRKDAGEEIATLVKISLPHENKQQEAIDKYVNAKALELQAKKDAKAAELNRIKEAVTFLGTELKTIIENSTFKSIKEDKKSFYSKIEDSEDFDFGDFKDVIEENIEGFKLDFGIKIGKLEDEEKERLRVEEEKKQLAIDQEKIRKEKEALEIQQKAIKDAQDKVIADKKIADQKIIDDKAAADKIIADNKKAADDKIAADQKIIDDKKIADDKVISDKKIADQKVIDDKAIADKKIADDKKALEIKTAADIKKKKADTARQKKLKPFKKKGVDIANGINLLLLVDNDEVDNLILEANNNIEALRSELIEKINDL